jgi:cytochrome c-type biogenesis protein CcmH/NrfG
MDTDRPMTTKTAAAGWTPNQAYVMAVVCLLVGIAAGYLWRGSEAPEKAATGVVAQMPAPPPSQTPPGSPMGIQITPEQLKGMADKQAEPMLQQLKAEANNADLLASIGNLYYDAQQFNDAVSYYDRALKLQPANTAVRTDMGTAFWYLGDADRAIREFQTVLKTEPTKANTLLNLGIVEWQGKMDGSAAIAAWQKLLDSNPKYENRDQVQQMIAEARKHANIKPGTKTSKPAL